MALPLLSDLTSLDSEVLADFLMHHYPDAKAAVIGGAHSFGMAESSSDLDIWVYRLIPAPHFLGLAHPQLVSTGSEVFGGRKLDVRALDLEAVCRAILDANYYELESLNSPLVLFGRDWLHDVRRRSHEAATRRVYYGVLRRASTVLRFRVGESHREVRQRLFAIRELLSGIHYLATRGQVVSDLLRLNQAHLRATYFEDALSYTLARRDNKASWMSQLTSDLELVTGRLDEAFHESELPDQVDAAPGLDHFLRTQRYTTFSAQQ